MASALWWIWMRLSSDGGGNSAGRLGDGEVRPGAGVSCWWVSVLCPHPELRSFSPSPPTPSLFQPKALVMRKKIHQNSKESVLVRQEQEKKGNQR